ncbi:putative bifunctional diguanylate cyclase/phosphodiesterase [Shewanella sp.]|uniref:putative bifunctional diguanylate cyclase/phosphodiesterase n=1 Tax=Shewanella sp. TaxID=50422 RepID=UPI003D13F4A8
MIAVVLILTVVGAAISTLAYRQLLNQEKVLLEAQRDKLAQSLSYSLSTAVEHSLQAAMQLGFVANAKGEDGAEGYQLLLSENWPDVQLYWDLKRFGLYSLDGDRLAHAGEPNSEDDLNWLLNSDISYELSSRVVCIEECAIQVLVPTLVNSKPHLFFFESALTEVISHFRTDRSIELAVLGTQKPEAEPGPLWGRHLYSISNRPSSFSLLSHMADNYSWQQISLGDEIYDYQGSRWAVWSFPLDQVANAPTIVVLMNLDQWQLMLSSFQLGLVGTLLVGLILAAGLMMLVAWKPVLSLAHHASLLPLLADHDFARVRASLPRKPSLFPDEVDLIHQATRQLADNMQGLESEVDEYTHELERLAMLDTLTGLPNKSMLNHELQTAIACIANEDDCVVLMFLDLDEFKRINDTLGHIQGDELLKIVAARLINSVREMDTVFRQGGDEFLILLRMVRDDQEVSNVIHRIFSALQHPVVLGSHKLIVTTSIGLAYCTSPHMRAEELIQHADLAMYQAKSAGRSNYRVFSEEMLNQANNRLMIEQSIEAAINEEQLVLFLQPIVELREAKLKGFEALIRWFHPERGLIMPGDFIPDIEHSEAIIHVGNYVIRKAAELIAQFKSAGWSELYIAVNLSAKHFLAPDLLNVVRQEVDAHDISAQSLVFEVTEESVIEQVESAMAAMESLQSLGVKIAIDDFGTGYSSLSYLKQLPFDLLKIDRSFTANVLDDEADAHIITTVIELAHNLGRQVVAEGIETQPQAQYLSCQQCELGQGYYFSRPMDVTSVFKVLSEIEHTRMWPVNQTPQPKLVRQGS